jgi:hypothetical protein
MPQDLKMYSTNTFYSTKLMTMLYSLAIAHLVVTFASANPFTIKQTPTDSKSAYISKIMKNALPTANSQVISLNY